ncbi:MAG: GntR family transcriptional regulator [Nocardioidaceae bacterium]
MSAWESADEVRALFEGSRKPLHASTGGRVADALRDLLIEGRFAPGTQLREEVFASGMNVSRNTLREALRLLANEGLVVHELNRGVFVRQLTAEDIHSIYQVREIIELAAVRNAQTHTPMRLSRVRLAVSQALAAEEAGDWALVGTANMNFHRSIAALAANVRIDAMIQRTLAELRLAFHVMNPLRDFHAPYLPDNILIARHLEAAEPEAAAEVLADYLERAKLQLVAAYENHAEESSGPNMSVIGASGA